MQAIKTILAAVDFSPDTETVLDAAVTLGKQFGARVRLIHAYDAPMPLASYDVGMPEPYMEETRPIAADKLAALVERVAGQGVTVDSILVEVPAAPAIVRVAAETGADLIVISLRHHTGIRHLLLGSVAERTVRHAPCSVLTVRAR